MVARKVFHVLVGFWFANLVFFPCYVAGVLLYAAVHGVPDDPSRSVFALLPRYGMMASVALPLAVGFVIWESRRYVAIGILIFAASSLVCWVALGRATLLLW